MQIKFSDGHKTVVVTWLASYLRTGVLTRLLTVNPTAYCPSSCQHATTNYAPPSLPCHATTNYAPPSLPCYSSCSKQTQQHAYNGCSAFNWASVILRANCNANIDAKDNSRMEPLICVKHNCNRWTQYILHKCLNKQCSCNQLHRTE